MRKTIILAALIGVVTFSIGTLMSPSIVTKTEISKSQLTYQAVACVDVTRADGTIEKMGCSENCLMDLGRDMIAAWLGNSTLSSTTANITKIAIGNGTVDYTTCAAGTSDDTTMVNEITIVNSDGCGMQRAAGTWYGYKGSLAAFNISHEFTSTCNSLVVNQTCLFNSTWTQGNNTIFACNDFTDVTLQANDKINVTWGIWIT